MGGAVSTHYQAPEGEGDHTQDQGGVGTGMLAHVCAGRHGNKIVIVSCELTCKVNVRIQCFPQKKVEEHFRPHPQTKSNCNYLAVGCNPASDL